MNRFFLDLRQAFRHNLPKRRQLIAWLISTGIILIILVFGRRSQVDNRGFLGYTFGLYLLDSAVFFALFAERPKLRLVMLTFIFLLEVAAAGFLVLKIASPAVR